MGVNPKIGGWMVKIVENPIKIGNLGGPPLFLETPTSTHSWWIFSANIGLMATRNPARKPVDMVNYLPLFTTGFCSSFR